VWGPCAGEIPPAGEICNTLDDDCDGAIDEDGVCPRVPPTVSCPGAMSVSTGSAVVLTGTGADPDGGSVTFAWSVATAPVGSTAAPVPPGDASTSFTADVGGAYTLRLCATDDDAQTACCTTTLDATSTCAPLPPPTVTSCGTSWDRRPILEFTPVPAGVVYELYRSGVATPYATVSTAGHVYHRPATELSAGADPPGEVAQLYVKACRVGEPACCSVSNQVTVALVSACDIPIDPTAENVVFSEYLINARGPLAGDEQGEAIEITNLSHCPVALNGTHFAYRHRTSMTGSFTYRWMDFGMDDVIPPRGVYVAVRDRASSMCTFPSLGAASDDSLFGLRISGLTMMGPSIGSSGWFNNNPTAESVLRIATGTWASAGMTLEPADGRTIEIVQPYLGTAPECSSIGFDAIGACGDDLQPTSPSPTAVLTPNQLGRLWRPCDAVTSPASGSGCP
ncbi:MAG: hypothetical protein IT379_07690, partial [Deltaproteobacteria bacterium]|nr:hypothetical protein [Deltaproteobacteria bacterium]